VGTECPDFELLSCFADGELAGAVAPEVTAHIGACGRCETLTGRLREGFGGAEAQPDGGVGGAGCVGEERLVLYASRGLQGDDRAAIAAHVSGCDPCVAALVRLHRRLSVLADVAAPVPASVFRRAQAVLPDALAEIAPRRAPVRVQPVASQASPGLLERLRGWLTMPALAPMAVGALAVFAVAVGLRPSSAPPDAERSRALAPAAVRMRVTGETTLYSRPSGNSDALGSVSRGAGAEVAGEERDWYQVRLEDGRSGWIVREAFE
jgi:anti-sigma factor ChrR (cupin superfamily)